VKSTSKRNVADQIRSGFGQVCEYAEHYLARGLEVVPVIYLPGQPKNCLLIDMAVRRGVRIEWPGSGDWITAIGKADKIV
jgi:hypothetical protein